MQYIDATILPAFINATPELCEFCHREYIERGAQWATSWIW